jgi:hypothetical protein
VINHRFGGLAEKILETQQIVFAKRTKDSKNGLGGIYVWKWDLYRGLFVDLPRHKKTG